MYIHSCKFRTRSRDSWPLSEFIAVFRYIYVCCTVGLMVSMSQMGRHGSSRAMAVVENQTAPVRTWGRFYETLLAQNYKSIASF
jgi:hypothetical protein